ncbi:unnamed protein product, partial [Amoebophrya sp. A120]
QPEAAADHDDSLTTTACLDEIFPPGWTFLFELLHPAMSATVIPIEETQLVFL